MPYPNLKVLPNTTSTLLQVQRVADEHLLRADLAWQDLLIPSKLDDGLDGLAVARQAVGEWVVSYQAAALRQGLGLAGQRGARVQLLQKCRLRFLEGSEQPRG